MKEIKINQALSLEQRLVKILKELAYEEQTTMSDIATRAIYAYYFTKKQESVENNND